MNDYLTFKFSILISLYKVLINELVFVLNKVKQGIETQGSWSNF